MRELELPVRNREELKRARTGLRVAVWFVIGCLLVGLAEATQFWLGVNAGGGRIDYARALKLTVPSWVVLAALAPAVFWMARRFPLFEGFERRRWFHWPIHVAAAVVFSLLNLAVANWIADVVLNALPNTTYLENLRRLLTSYGTLNLAFYGALVGGWHAWNYNRRLQERERAASELALRASRLESSLTTAKLEALRMQLNPHFLFNTLNTISVLAMKGERGSVTRIVGRLSDLLRLSLDNRRQLVTLAEELEFVDGYVDIEQTRFRDRLTVIRDVEPAARDAEVPSLLLQPLVENAIRHGIGRSSGGGEVRIVARLAEGRLELEVRDTGPGFGTGPIAGSEGEAERRAMTEVAGTSGAGIGLENTRARIEELYGAAGSFSFGDASEGGAVVRIGIPFRRGVRTERPESGAAKRA